MKKQQYAQIGTVSHGTMREEDLIPEFTDTLEYYAKQNNRKDHLAIVEEIRGRMDNDDYYQSDDASWDLNETLFDALNEYAMPYFYFGSHLGDGSDYGYWLSEGFEEEFDGLKVSDLNDVPKGYTGELLEVNDHGNMTLYKVVRGRKYEVWAIV